MKLYQKADLTWNTELQECEFGIRKRIEYLYRNKNEMNISVIQIIIEIDDLKNTEKERNDLVE